MGTPMEVPVSVQSLHLVPTGLAYLPASLEEESPSSFTHRLIAIDRSIGEEENSKID